MKRLMIFLGLMLGMANAQLTPSPGVIYVGSAPSGACTTAPPLQVLTSSGAIYSCNNGTWGSASGSGTVTSFIDSSGLFSVATSTTTPTTTYATQSANTAFGNFTGSTAAPSFTATTGTGSPVAATSPTFVTSIITPSVTSPGALSISAGGSNQNITIAPSGTGLLTTNTAPSGNGTVGTTFNDTFATASGAFNVPFAAYAPNIQNGAKVQLLFGQAASSNNEFVETLNFTSSGSAANTINFALFSTSLLTFAANAKATFDGPIIDGNTAFTVSGCGTAGSISGSGTAGNFNVGTGATNCTFTITLNGATGMTATRGWIANADDVTLPVHCINGATVSTTTVVFTCTGTIGTNDLIKFSAVAY